VQEQPDLHIDIAHWWERLVDWVKLGWYDLTLTYRRTVIGPLWQSAQLALWAGGLAIVFRPMHAENPEYVPYLVVGLAVWNFLSSAIGQGASVFVANAGIILNAPVSLGLYIIRLWSNLVFKFLFQLLVFLPVALFYGVGPGVYAPYALAAVVLLCAATVPIIIITGVVSTYYRDLEHLIAVTMRFMFFLTPVFWIPREGTFQTEFVMFNPLYYPLEMVRQPLLGHDVKTAPWLVTLVLSVTASLIAWRLLARFGRKIAAWL
jgi:ABC-type polysaccharide/polyol phosphate export permease